MVFFEMNKKWIKLYYKKFEFKIKRLSMLYILINKNGRILEFEYNLDYVAFLGMKKIYSLKYALISLMNCRSKELNKELLKWPNDKKSYY